MTSAILWRAIISRISARSSVWVMLASIAVLGIVFKVLIAAALRRRALRLDEETALAIVLEQLRLGMIVNAALVPRACVWIRRGLAAPPGRPGSSVS